MQVRTVWGPGRMPPARERPVAEWHARHFALMSQVVLAAHAVRHDRPVTACIHHTQQAARSPATGSGCWGCCQPRRPPEPRRSAQAAATGLRVGGAALSVSLSLCLIPPLRACPAKNLSCTASQPPSLPSTAHALLTLGSLLRLASPLSTGLRMPEQGSGLLLLCTYTLCVISYSSCDL